jgi:hypothetical protein
MLAIVGAFLLFVGVFLPIVSMPIVGSLNYFHNGQGDGTIVLVLAAISIILAVTKSFRGLWVTGLCSIGLMLFALVGFLMRISEVREQMQTQLADNPFRGLADVAMNSVQLQWGWAVLILGGVLIVVAAAMRGPATPDVQRASGVGTTAKWGGATVGIFLLLLGLASLLKTRQAVEPSASVQKTASEPSAGSSLEPTTNDSEWILNDFKDEMDNTPIVILTKSGAGGTSLVIRCAKHKTQAYVDTDTVVDSSGVRIKFDQAQPLRQSWARSTDYKALFAPDAVTLARELVKTKTFMIEFTPFQEGTRAISFDVSNLGAKLQKIAEACDWAGVDEGRARARAASAALRARLAQYVHQCGDQDIEKVLGKRWCWSDPDDALFKHDNGWEETREKALDDAVENARMGLAFKRN